MQLLNRFPTELFPDSNFASAAAARLVLASSKKTGKWTKRFGIVALQETRTLVSNCSQQCHISAVLTHKTLVCKSLPRPSFWIRSF